jgi:hypothetical protein
MNVLGDNHVVDGLLAFLENRGSPFQVRVLARPPMRSRACTWTRPEQFEARFEKSVASTFSPGSIGKRGERYCLDTITPRLKLILRATQVTKSNIEPCIGGKVLRAVGLRNRGAERASQLARLSSGQSGPITHSLPPFELGDRDLALARQELHRAHFAQIHAHRVIRACGQF